MEMTTKLLLHRGEETPRRAVISSSTYQLVCMLSKYNNTNNASVIYIISTNNIEI